MTDWPTTDPAGWRAAIAELPAEEKAATRTLDALAAERRRLPMVEFDADHRFLHARDTTLALVSRAPIDEIEPVRRRMGWTVPWYSSDGSDFNRDVEVTTDAGESFALSVFLRDGDRVLRTHVTDGRGVENLGTTWSLLDLTPFGRQERWEDSPAGRPQFPPYAWWRLHDDDEPVGADAEVDA